MKYAYRDSGGWNIETVDSNEDVGIDSSLVLDSDGYPHISYCGTIGDRLKYADRDSEGWSIETIISGEGSASRCSLALTGEDFPHITYYSVGHRELMYLYQYYVELSDVPTIESHESQGCSRCGG